MSVATISPLASGVNFSNPLRAERNEWIEIFRSESGECFAKVKFAGSVICEKLPVRWCIPQIPLDALNQTNATLSLDLKNREVKILPKMGLKGGSTYVNQWLDLIKNSWRQTKALEQAAKIFDEKGMGSVDESFSVIDKYIDTLLTTVRPDRFYEKVRDELAKMAQRDVENFIRRVHQESRLNEVYYEREQKKAEIRRHNGFISGKLKSKGKTSHNIQTCREATAGLRILLGKEEDKIEKYYKFFRENPTLEQVREDISKCERYLRGAIKLLEEFRRDGLSENLPEMIQLKQDIASAKGVLQKLKQMEAGLVEAWRKFRAIEPEIIRLKKDIRDGEKALKDHEQELSKIDTDISRTREKNRILIARLKEISDENKIPNSR